MNDCPRPDVLSSLVDGECDHNQRRGLHEHLRECDTCQRVFDGYARVRHLIGRMPRLVAPEDFVSGLIHRGPAFWSRAGSSFVLRGRRRYVSASIAAAAIAISAAGFAAPPEAEPVPVDVMMTRHVSTSADASVVFAVTRSK